MLTDREIRPAVAEGLMAIEPLADASLQPASYDFKLNEPVESP